jgi:hypothetical protein
MLIFIMIFETFFLGGVGMYKHCKDRTFFIKSFKKAMLL